MALETRSISVRDLVQYKYRTGDLNLESFDGSALEAIRIHTKIQNSRGPDYDSEVYVSNRFEYQHFTITVSGKMDGLFSSGIIEEIKTTSMDISELNLHCNLQYLAQLKVYCYLYIMQRRMESVTGRLTYYVRKTQDILEFEELFFKDELEIFFYELLDEYLLWVDMAINLVSERDETISKMRFPFDGMRHGQKHMIDVVASSIKKQENYIIEAPTGIGKSISTIYPSIEALPHGIDKIFYLTAKNSGFQSSSDAILALKNIGLKIKSLTLTSKEKVCVNVGAQCNAKSCGFANGFFDRVNEAIIDILQHDDLDTKTIHSFSMKHYICPFEFALILTEFADVIICDYNYVFDPRVAIKRLFEDNVGKFVFLVDEAHNLVDRARSMFSADISLKMMEYLILEIASQNLDIVATLRKVVDEIVEIMDISVDSEFVVTVELEDLLSALKDFMSASERWLIKGRSRSYRNQLIEVYFQARSFINIFELYDEKYSIIAEKKDDDSIITIYNVDPSTNIALSLSRAVTTIFFSATVIPKEYYSYMFNTKDNYVTLDSPYDKENHRIISASFISTYYKDRDDSIESIVKLLNQYLSKKNGNTIVFFPSYSYMNQFWHFYQEYLDKDYEYVIQEPSMSATLRDKFLEQFTETSNIVGFAVLGGVFGEGIDLKGSRLSGVFVVGVGLPGISIYNKTIQDYFQNVNSSGFEYAYTYPGFVKVLQACGRLIRGEDDRGVITIVDKRYGYSTYSQMYPTHWNYQKSVSLKQYNYFLDKFLKDR